jgi:hypothetical protein
MRVALVAPLVAAVFVGGASISAQEATVRQTKKPVWNLFEDPFKPALPTPLFMTPRLLQRGQQDARSTPKIVCGMTLIPADPNIDSAIRHAVPGNGPAYSIRAVNPPACRR